VAALAMALVLAAAWLLSSSGTPGAVAATPALAVPAQVATVPGGGTNAAPSTGAPAPAAPSAAPTTTAAGAQTKIGDPASDRRIRRIVIALLALAVVVLVITIIFWRVTKPVPKAFGRLDVMGSRAWRKSDETRRAELLGRPVPLTIVPDGVDDAVPDVDPAGVPAPPASEPLVFSASDQPISDQTVDAAPSVGVVAAVGEAREPDALDEPVDAAPADPEPARAEREAGSRPAAGAGNDLPAERVVPVPPPPGASGPDELGAPPLEVVGDHQPGETSA